mgnify:CR=1 FL=1
MIYTVLNIVDISKKRRHYGAGRKWRHRLMAMESLLIIIVVLAVLLIVGVPISYSIGISALIAILRTVPFGKYRW